MRLGQADSVEAEVAERLVAGLRAQIPAQVVLKGIEVAVGETVEVDALGLGRALGELLPGLEIRIVRVAVLYKCADCGAEFPADEHPCPVCGSVRVSMVHGEELGITRAFS